MGFKNQMKQHIHKKLSFKYEKLKYKKRKKQYNLNPRESLQNLIILYINV